MKTSSTLQASKRPPSPDRKGFGSFAADETKRGFKRELFAQEELLPFLLNPRSYPHKPGTVRLLQTHASFVFIAPPLVYKVKKSVNFGFLDFSTLEKRRHFCEREVTLNRRLCPHVYLDVVPISLTANGLSFGDDGVRVEYAIKMRKLPERGFLDRLVARNQVTPADMHRIAVVLKKFYETQHPTPDIEEWGRIDRLRISTDENFRQTRKFIDQTISRAAYETIQSYTNRFYARQKPLFTSRIREQRIRDCHGDLHLDHIHLTSRAVHIYDCIEFNDRFRYVDVANDIAFLAMDLDFRGRPDLSTGFARTMASELADSGMPLLLNFYKCYRAYVRGKVESLHSVTQAAPEDERRTSAERARRYFRLALQYAIAGSQPMVIAVMGGIGSGKSTLSRALGGELGWEVLSSDHLRKKLAGFPLHERRSATTRKRLYSAEMTKKTYQRLFDTAKERLARGHNVILDATFSRPEHRARLATRFGKHGIDWCVLEAHASSAVVKKRLHARESASAEVSDARLEDLERLSGLYDAPDELPTEKRTRIGTGGPVEQSVKRALKSLAHRQADTVPTDANFAPFQC